ncbi:hypothetical protein C2G38_2104554 [Gigaspora rosea]|uniref:Uncharacterized protein n=1 Tax=Gigaspora rosea TaxID=44941 RepID=A0A397UNF5_9GLOM|nr:hypothetical protein C2G38_2104554 [Gigaspora rosea]
MRKGRILVDNDLREATGSKISLIIDDIDMEENFVDYCDQCFDDIINMRLHHIS